MFNIGGYGAPSPQEAEYLPVTIGDFSRRNALGEKVGDIIARKRNLRLAWRMLSLSEANRLLGAVSSPFFTVEYIDPATSQSVSARYTRAGCVLKYLSADKFALTLELEEK